MAAQAARKRPRPTARARTTFDIPHVPPAGDSAKGARERQGKVWLTGCGNDAGGVSYGSRRSERSERPPDERGEVVSDRGSGRGEIHAAWYLIRDSYRSRVNSPARF